MHFYTSFPGVVNQCSILNGVIPNGVPQPMHQDCDNIPSYRGNRNQ